MQLDIPTLLMELVRRISAGQQEATNKSPENRFRTNNDTHTPLKKMETNHQNSNKQLENCSNT